MEARAGILDFLNFLFINSAKTSFICRSIGQVAYNWAHTYLLLYKCLSLSKVKNSSLHLLNCFNSLIY